MADENSTQVFVEIDGLDSLTEKFNTLARQIADLPNELIREFVKWQTDDMGRKYPTYQVGQAGQGSVSTSIFPRSRRKRTSKSKKGRATRLVARKAPQPGGSSRPILRPELLEKLEERMTQTCEEALQWP